MSDQKVPTPGVAVTSLVFGILGVAACLGPIGAIPAIVCGHIAQSKIRKSEGALGGEGIALGGLITGYVTLAISIFVLPMLAAMAIPSLIQARTEVQKNVIVSNLRAIESAVDRVMLEEKYSSTEQVSIAQVEPFIVEGSIQAMNWPEGVVPPTEEDIRRSGAEGLSVEFQGELLSARGY